MKKIIAILLLFVAMNASAQHLQFMGLTLNGSIESFQSWLISKGLKYDREFSVTHPGIRWFDGIFCGYDASVIVYYDTKTKIVYRAKAVIHNENLKYVERVYEEIMDMLVKKYKDACYGEDLYEERDELLIFVLKNGITDCDSEDYLGTIGLYIRETESGYSLSIDYTDRINKSKYQSSKASDL